MAETKTDADVAFDAFIESLPGQVRQGCRVLEKDREALLAFYDFPAEHWKHLRTTNPIESTFATVRHRTIRAKGCLSNKTALAMVFKLVDGAQKTWRKLDGHNQLPKIIQGVKFADGLEVVVKPATPFKPKPPPPDPSGRHQESGDSSRFEVGGLCQKLIAIALKTNGVGLIDCPREAVGAHCRVAGFSRLL